MPKSKSYKSYYGQDCIHLDYNDEICWGQVKMEYCNYVNTKKSYNNGIYDIYVPVCEGHMRNILNSYSKYKKENNE